MRAFMLVPLAAGLLLGGCAELNSIYRRTALPDANEGGVYTVDAKQRHLIVVPDAESASKWRVCAEAAPDVFSAYAASLGAQGNRDGGQLSLAAAETAATIERTQTINMLREAFYRTCERYASGATTRQQFIIQAARDQRSMVAILAIEQLTGALRPRSTLISPAGTAASTLSGERAAALLSDYQTRRNTAEESLKEARAKVAEAEKEGGVCADPTKAGDCQALKTSLADREKELVEAQKGLDNMVELAKDLVSATSASTTGNSQQGGGIAQSDISRNNLATVAWAVTNIVGMSNINEPLMACIAWFTDERSAGPDLTAICSKILEAQQRQDNTLLSNLTPDDMTSFTKALMLADDYKAFKERLIGYMEAVSDQEFAAKLSKFEASLGDSFLSGAPQCRTRSGCIAFAKEEGNDPYMTAFQTNQVKAQAALEEWSQ